MNPKNLKRRLLRVCTLVVLASAALAGPAPAEEPCPETGVGCEQDALIRIELNRLEPAGEACRPNLVLTNGTDLTLSEFRLDMVMFDIDGIVADRLAVNASPLLPGKTSLIVFEAPSIACDGVGRVLINAVLACSGGPETLGGCLNLIEPSSRTDVALFK